MREETFLNYQRFFWLWVNLALLIGLTAIYVWHTPIGGPSGGTILGYVYGGIATAGILYLMWFGIRKRAYYSRHTTLKGCLAAHVWLGLALTIIVPLHAGFSFGLNVHTLAYALMVITILSGVVGAWMYIAYPRSIMSHRGGGSLAALLEQIKVFDSDIEAATRDKSDQFIKLVDRFDHAPKLSVWAALRGRETAQIETSAAAAAVRELPEDEHAEGLRLISLISQKQQAVDKVLEETRILALLKAWLYVHVPVSCALVACVLIHIFTVFFYW